MGSFSSDTQAGYDSLTHLKDRVTFFKDVRHYAESGRHAHIIMIQLSQLMWVNHKYGVAAGDELLRIIARYLESLHENYSAYRVANSRLMLAGPECSRQEADSIVEQIEQRFTQEWQASSKGHTYTVLTSAYIVHLFHEPEDCENGLMDKINYAAYTLSEKEKEGSIFFDEEIRQALERKNYILEEVRHAVEQQTFQMYYQPIYNSKKDRFTSAESLVRLFARDGSVISPAEFIPMAEANGLIDPISWIVLEKVCRFLGENPTLPLDTISVNLTGQQILDPTFLNRIDDLLAFNHLDGRRLRIEITERTVTDDFEGVQKIMEHLARKGIRFYLDDFGTGYSNLSSMLSLPFEVIKFDQSLIQIMSDSGKGKNTIHLLADLMHENDYFIVAEGIETEAQAAMAQENHLDRIQGYYYAKPMPEEELKRFLRQYA